MANDWVKVRHDLRDDPAVFDMADQLGVKPVCVIGAVVVFWGWADKHTEDGFLKKVTARTVDRLVDTEGFCEAMAAVGWLTVEADGLRIPQFDRHNSESAKARGLRNARQARWRQNKEEASPSTEASTQASQQRLPEKIREEITPYPNGYGESPASPVVEKKDKFPACPASELVEIYHDCLPTLPRVEVLTDQRKGHARARWLESCQRLKAEGGPHDRHAVLGYWRRFFEYVSQSKFLTGQTSGKNGRPFVADFGWLVKPENYVKVVEGRYHDEAGTRH